MPALPGFSGYVPPDKKPVLAMKTALSERLPLPDRALQATHSSVSRTVSTAPDPAKPNLGKSFFLPKRHVGYTTYGSAAQSYVRSQEDVPARVSEKAFYGAGAYDTPKAKFDATTTKQDASGKYSTTGDPAFYSKVRQVERRDDDARHSLEDPKTRSGAAKNLRCTAIQNKRECDADFAPPPMQFARTEPVRPNPLTMAGGHHPSMAKPSLLTTATTQRQDFPDPRDVAAKERSILSDKGARTRLAPDRAIVEGATSRDLFGGTAKASEDIASGFMGHVPASQKNIDRVHGAADPLRSHTKVFVTVTEPTGNSNTSLMRRKMQAAAVAAEAQGQPLPGRTVQDHYTKQAAFARQERGMNQVECGRKNSVRTFFTRGVGDQDDVVADQFCVRFRPLEGSMRHGPPASHTWVSDTELRRAPRM